MNRSPIDCTWISRNLDEILRGCISSSDQQSLREHIDRCETCAAMLSMTILGGSDPDRCDAEKQISEILELTSGETCTDAQSRIFSASTDAAENVLLAGHLDHCASCRLVATAWGWIREELREMATLEVDQELTDLILDRTVRAIPQPGLGERIRKALEWFSGMLIHRRRAAWELGYICALPIVLFFNPLSIPDESLKPRFDYASAMTDDARSEVARAAAGLGRAVDDRFGSVRKTVTGSVTQSIRAVDSFYRSLGDLTDVVNTEMKSALKACSAGNFDGGIRHAESAWSAITQFEVSHVSNKPMEGESNGTESNESL